MDEQDDEFLLYQELRFIESSARELCNESVGCELTKILDDEDENRLLNRNLGCGDNNSPTGNEDDDCLHLTSIIDSFDQFVDHSPQPMDTSNAPATIDPLDCYPSHEAEHHHHHHHHHHESYGYNNQQQQHDNLHQSNQFDHQQTQISMVADSSSGGGAGAMNREHLCDYGGEFEAARSHQDVCNQSEDSGVQMMSCSIASSTTTTATMSPAIINTPPVISSSSSSSSTAQQTPDLQYHEEVDDQTQMTPNSNNAAGKQKSSTTSAGGGRRKPLVNHYRRRTANARERIRMREINQAFEKLKRVVPLELVKQASEAERLSEQQQQEASARTNKSANKTPSPSSNQASSSSDDTSPKLTKITTLRLAASYIARLSSLLADNPESVLREQAAQDQTNQKNGTQTNEISSNKSVTTNGNSNDSNNNNNKTRKRSRSKQQSRKVCGGAKSDLGDNEQIKSGTLNSNSKPRARRKKADVKQQMPLQQQQQQQTAYIAIANQQTNQRQQQCIATTTYPSQPLQQAQPLQQHQQMISHQQFSVQPSNGRDRPLVGSIPVAILVPNLIYINPMNPNVRNQMHQQQQQHSHLQHLQQPAQQQQQPPQQVCFVNQIQANGSGRLQLQAQQQQQQQIVMKQLQQPLQVDSCNTESGVSYGGAAVGESLESNINKLVASLASTGAADAQNQRAAVGGGPASPCCNDNQQQQQRAPSQQQAVRTYRFHNYDGNMITNHLYSQNNNGNQSATTANNSNTASSANNNEKQLQQQQQQQFVRIVKQFL